MDGKSLNVNTEKLKQLKAILPEVFSEGKVDFKRLQLALGEEVVIDGEHYELSWAGKSEARKELQKQTTSTLILNKQKSISSKDSDHIFIEGENLEVLKVLQRSYFAKVKMIYIDPPYNTGNDSFVYADNFKERQNQYKKRTGISNEDGYLNQQSIWKKNTKENGQFHSNWLSMMYPRLFLCRNLLSEDGAIVIHIDENEKSNLELLLNEIFGEENNLGVIVWDKGNPKGDAKGVATQHEYLLVFAKNKDIFTKKNLLIRAKKNAEKILKKAEKEFKRLGEKSLPTDLKNVVKNYNLSNQIIHQHTKEITLEDVNTAFQKWLKKQNNLSGGELAYNKIDKNGNVFRLVSMAWPNKKTAPDDYQKPLIHPITGKACAMPARGWRYPTSTMEKMLVNGDIVFGKNETTQPQRKYLLKENLYENLPSILFFGGSDDQLFKKLNLSFENPKPKELVKQMIKIFSRSAGDMILDCFAGSGTLAHAVLELNEESEPNRKFICIQLPEKVKNKNQTIADISTQRIKKVIEQLEEKRIEQLDIEDQNILGFSVFQLAQSHFKSWRSDRINEKNILEQLTEFVQTEKKNSEQDDLFFELCLKSGLELNVAYDQSDGFYKTEASIWFGFEAFSSKIKATILGEIPQKVVMLNSCFTNDAELTNFKLALKANGILLDLI